MAGIPLPPHMLLKKGGGANISQERNKRASDDFQPGYDKRPRFGQGGCGPQPLMGRFPSTSSTSYPRPALLTSPATPNQFKSHVGAGRPNETEILMFLRKHQRPVSTKEIISNCGPQFRDTVMSTIYNLGDRGIIKRAPGRIQAWRIDAKSDNSCESTADNNGLSPHAKDLTGRLHTGGEGNSNLSWRSNASTPSQSHSSSRSSPGGMPLPPHIVDVQSPGGPSCGPPPPPHLINASMSEPSHPPHLLNSSTSEGVPTPPHLLNTSASSEPTSEPDLLSHPKSEQTDQEITENVMPVSANSSIQVCNEEFAGPVKKEDNENVIDAQEVSLETSESRSQSTSSNSYNEPPVEEAKKEDGLDVPSDTIAGKDGPPAPPHTISSKGGPPAHPHTISGKVGPPAPPLILSGKRGPPAPPHIISGKGGPPAPPHTISGKDGPPAPPHTISGKGGPPQPPHTISSKGGPPEPPNIISSKGGPPAPPHIITGKGGLPPPPHILTGKGGPTLTSKGPTHAPHLLSAGREQSFQKTVNIQRSEENIGIKRPSLLRPSYLDESETSPSIGLTQSSKSIPASEALPQSSIQNSANRSVGPPLPPHVMTGKGAPPMPPHMLSGKSTPTQSSPRPMGQNHISATSRPTPPRMVTGKGGPLSSSPLSAAQIDTPRAQANSNYSSPRPSAANSGLSKPGGPPAPPHVITGKGGPPLPPHVLSGKGGPTLPPPSLRGGNIQTRYTSPQNLMRATPPNPPKPPKPQRHQSPQQSCSMLSADVFNSLNKNPVSALNELVQKQGKEVTFELINQGKGGKNKFTVACKIAGHLYDAVSAPNMKEAKRDASEAALRAIMGQNAFNVKSAGTKDVISNLKNPPRTGLSHFDNIAFLCNHAFMQLSTMVKTNFAGKKVIAGIVMKEHEGDGGRVISVGSGNRCITGERLSLEGKVVNDSHAEIICRRGFIRFLYSELEKLLDGDDSTIFTTYGDKAKVKDGISFHLYISTAPCGDGALFTPRENQAASTLPTAHTPEFSSKVQGVLRTKIEDGEGTIPIPHDEREQTMDGILRGQRLRTMSCSDKVCRWNVLGLQGGLLSNLIHPVYLKSLTLGYLFDHGHLSRALCCRLEKDGNMELPQPFAVHHPWLGRITKYDVSRETEKTNNISINWCAYDSGPEVTDGRIGAQLERSNYAPTVSRLCKVELFRRFRQICTKFGNCDELLALETYREAKDAATDFQTAKKHMMERFRKGKFGNWLSKPAEQDMSIGLPK